MGYAKRGARMRISSCSVSSGDMRNVEDAMYALFGLDDHYPIRVAQDVPARVTMRILGQSQMSLTTDRYGHVMKT